LAFSGKKSRYGQNIQPVVLVLDKCTSFVRESTDICRTEITVCDNPPDSKTNL
ncbi:hypothetical protein L9F63_023875, partial [Diploptera punctata]